MIHADAILILGGGPAGVVVSKQLRALGHDATIITESRRFQALEGLSERAYAGLAHVGCRHALAAANAQVTRQASWNGEHFRGNTERLVDRHQFDQALLADARDAGIEIHTGKVIRVAAETDCCRVTWRDVAHRERRTDTAYVIDARGRGTGRRGAWRSGPRSVSIGQTWLHSKSIDPITCVATFDRGWGWLACDRHGTMIVQVFVSIEQQPLVPRLVPRPRLANHYHDLVSTINEFADILCDARPQGELHVRDASTALNNTLFDGTRVQVGDAAFHVDPLAGHGLFEAIGGALALAPAVNTLLRRPDQRDLAERFYREKLHDDFLRMARVGRDFYRQEQRWPQNAFWHERQTWPDDEPAHAPGHQYPPRIESRPVSDNGFIVERDVIVTADHPRGVWQVAGVPLAALKQWLDEAHIDNATVACAAQQFRQSESAVNTAIAWLEHRGLVT